MNKVRVQLFADLRQFSSGAPWVDVDLTEGDTIKAVIDRLGIPPERVKIVFLNARATSLERTLEGGERLSLFSSVGGG
jgi:sulfur-carrier protein